MFELRDLTPRDIEPAGQLGLDDDIDAAHMLAVQLGTRPTPVERAWPHRFFRATDPEGNTLRFHTSHAAGPV